MNDDFCSTSIWQSNSSLGAFALCFGGRSTLPILVPEFLLIIATKAAPNIFAFTVEDLRHQPVSLSKYAGKVCIVVNVAAL